MTQRSAWMTDELDGLRALARDFLAKEVAPNIEKFIDQHHVDRDLWNKAGEVVIEPGDVAVTPAAVDQIVSTIRVFEHELIDGLRAVVELPHQRLVEVVHKRPGRSVGNSHRRVNASLHALQSEFSPRRSSCTASLLSNSSP